MIQEGKRFCPHICINTFGSYECHCQPGFVNAYLNTTKEGHICIPGMIIMCLKLKLACQLSNNLVKSGLQCIPCSGPCVKLML